MKLKATKGENPPAVRIAAVSPPPSRAESSPTPSKTPKVPITDSLATKPVRIATEAVQKPKPSGVNNGAIKLPILASIESSMLSTMLKPPATKPKFERNQTTTHIAKMMVPARTK